ncbi:hypothetical protein L1987_37170 [Smallanthus sonchifolius]|uniref:Uncharacterized protein n=1 Tax=Smallanthus sonchifolius TaxID=185202 RepID=A0ACB9HGW8_9ASTR|nr:hypothetical protein L1987_37170 [Smallanthus sonchifolius]
MNPPIGKKVARAQRPKRVNSVAKSLSHTQSLLCGLLGINEHRRSFCSVRNRRSNCMDNSKEEKNAPWLSVPQFGDWDQKGPLPDYSLDFSKIREKRKQNKRELSRTSIGNEEEFVSSNKSKLDTPEPQPQLIASDQDYSHPPTNRRSLLSCFSCCVKA